MLKHTMNNVINDKFIQSKNLKNSEIKILKSSTGSKLIIEKSD